MLGHGYQSSESGFPSTLITDRHFVSSIVAWNFPFHVTLAADPLAEGRALFGKLKSATIYSMASKELYDRILSSGDCSVVSGYLILDPMRLT